MAKRVGFEEKVRLYRDRWIGERGIFIGMNGFSTGGPGPALYKHFSITLEAVADAEAELAGG